ncbi:hypothetical protein ACFPJ1_43060 [Kribbella qitaiheensis]|uniref:hypothetical protein n=1 Tax=Kribbella qitaiheensis TaxID=1544730 RepID=UPI003617D516
MATNGDLFASLLLWSNAPADVRDAAMPAVVMGTLPPTTPARRTMATFTAVDQAERSFNVQRAAVVEAVVEAVTETANAVKNLRDRDEPLGAITDALRKDARALLGKIDQELDDATVDLVLIAGGAQQPSGAPAATHDELVARAAVLLREQDARNDEKGRALAQKVLAKLSGNGGVSPATASVVLQAAVDRQPAEKRSVKEPRRPEKKRSPSKKRS